MKKMFVCALAAALFMLACKKDVIDKKLAAKPKAVEAVTTNAAAPPAAPYDYQKAIMAKRTLNPDLSK